MVIGKYGAAMEDTETTVVIDIVVSKDSTGIRSSQMTVAIDMENGETAPWLNDGDGWYGVSARTVRGSGQQRQLWRLLWRSARLRLG